MATKAKGIPVEEARRLATAGYRWLVRHNFDEECEPGWRADWRAFRPRSVMGGARIRDWRLRPRLPGGVARLSIRGSAPKDPLAARVFSTMRIAYYSAAIANDLKVAASDMKLRKELQTARRALERLNKERALTVARYRVDLDADMRRVLEGLNDLVVRAGTMGGKKVPRSAREWDAFITAATENLGTGGMGRGDVAELLHGAPRAQRARGSALKKKTTKAGVRRTRKERVRKSDQRRFVKKGTKVAPDG